MSLNPQEQGLPQSTDAQTNTRGPLFGLLRRLFWPPAYFAYSRKNAAIKKASKVNLDAELKLYSEMFPSGFLHYGYFSDANVEAKDISFGDLDRAQINYAENLLSLISDKENPVLDVGCGTGGISDMFIESGGKAIALTPDQHQIDYIKTHRSHIQVIESKFEDFDPAPYVGKFGTILTSESLQYLDLDVSVPKIKALLKPGGKWVACDYFCLSEKTSSGHNWEVFEDALKKHGFVITHNQDITPNILPTLLFAQLLSKRFVFPAFLFSENKLRKKFPKLHYLLEEIFEKIMAKMNRGMRSLDPEAFRREKRYVTLVIEQAS